VSVVNCRYHLNTNMDYKYIRLEIADTYGISKGKVVTKEFYDQHIFKGLAMNMLSIIGESSACEVVEDTGLAEIGYPDFFFYPDVKTLKVLPWLPCTATVLGDARICPSNENSAHLSTCSRGILKNAIEKLSNIGLSIFGAFEYEFHLYDLETNEMILSSGHSSVTSIQSKYEPLVKDIMDNLSKLGISPESYQIEAGVGQFEITYKPSYNLEIADNAIRFKETVKETCYKHNYFASFMSKPSVDCNGSSGHINHSLWNADGENVFFNANDVNKLSQIAKHWIAGLQYHSKAMSCLQASNINCFERIKNRPFLFTNAWGLDNRTTCYRIKNYDESRTYIECRYPGAGVNQYLGLASVIFAGIDGIDRKLELIQEQPYKGDTSKIDFHLSCPKELEFMPRSLEEALSCLNSSEMLRHALGEEFLNIFTALRNHDISESKKAVLLSKTDWDWQNRQYFSHL